MVQSDDPTISILVAQKETDKKKSRKQQDDAALHAARLNRLLNQQNALTVLMCQSSSVGGGKSAFSGDEMRRPPFDAKYFREILAVNGTLPTPESMLRRRRMSQDGNSPKAAA